MLGTSIFSNIVAFIFWALCFSNTIVFWMSLSIVRKKIAPETVAAIWKNHEAIQLACFLAFIITTSYEEALLKRPRSRLHTGFVGLFFSFLLTGLSWSTLQSALLIADYLLLLNYILWVMALLLGFVQSFLLVERWKQATV
jgi:hypothetical protein